MDRAIKTNDNRKFILDYLRYGAKDTADAWGVAVSDVPKIADMYASNIVLPTINTGKYEGHSKKSTMYYCIEDFRKYDVYRLSQQYKVHSLDIGVYLYKFISELQIPADRLKYTNENKQEFIKQYESNMSRESIMEFWGINSKYIDRNYWKFKGIQKSAKYELHNKDMMWCKRALERLEYDCENKGKRQVSNDWELSINEIDIILDAYKKIKAHHRIQWDTYRIQRFIEECERYGCENVANRWGFTVDATKDMLKRLKS